MYRRHCQVGFLTLMSGTGSKPLDDWDIFEKDGYIRRFLDPELKALVIELTGVNVSTTYAVCPKKGKPSLAIRMPFLVMVVKNIHKYWTFEVTVLDDWGMRRRYRAANFQSSTSISTTSTSMPIKLQEGWNQIHFNLADFTHRAYNRTYIETLQVRINANIRVRRIYFADRIYRDCELPHEYRLFFPMTAKGKKDALNSEDKENLSPAMSKIIKVLTEPAKREDEVFTFPDTRRRESSDLFPRRKYHVEKKDEETEKKEEHKHISETKLEHVESDATAHPLGLPKTPDQSRSFPKDVSPDDEYQNNEEIVFEEIAPEETVSSLSVIKTPTSDFNLSFPDNRKHMIPDLPTDLAEVSQAKVIVMPAKSDLLAVKEESGTVAEITEITEEAPASNVEELILQGVPIINDVAVETASLREDTLRLSGFTTPGGSVA